MSAAEAMAPAALIYFQAIDAVRRAPRRAPGSRSLQEKHEHDPEQIRQFEGRREAILKKPWRTTRKAIPRDVYEGDWNTRFQAICTHRRRTCGAPRPPQQLRAAMSSVTDASLPSQWRPSGALSTTATRR